MELAFYCYRCGAPCDRELIAALCPRCQVPTVWTTTPRTETAWPFLLSNDDRDFLKLQKIRSD